MANQTKQEVEQSNQELISVDPNTGELIVSKDHRDMNMIMVDFALSFMPIEVYVNAEGKIADVRLEKRRISLVVANNMPIQSDSFIKPFADTVLEFTAESQIVLAPNTLATIFFHRTFN